MNPVFSPSPWIMQNIDLWSSLTKKSETVVFKREEIVYEVGDQMECVYIVKNGRVRLTSLGSSGNEQIFMFMEQGSMFGETGYFERGLHATRAVSICHTELYCVPLPVFREQLDCDLSFCHNVLALYSQKLNLLIGRMESLAFSDTYIRTAQIFLDLIEMYGTHTEEGYRIEVTVTHQNIANLVNSTRVTINKIIRRMEQEGILMRGRKYYTIVSVDALREIVNSQYTTGDL